MANRYQGKQGKGSKRTDRVNKRHEAEERNSRTLPERRRSARINGKASA